MTGGWKWFASPPRILNPPNISRHKAGAPVPGGLFQLYRNDITSPDRRSATLSSGTTLSAPPVSNAALGMP